MILNRLLRSDIEFGGPLIIIEPVTRLNNPAYRRVRLCDQVSGILVGEKWSDKITGLVTFDFIRVGPWELRVHDHTGEFEEAAVGDRMATADGSRP